jgi:hypothetical protein
VNCRQHQSGLSYVEVLIAVVIMAATVIPVTDALRGAMHTADADSVATVNHYRLVGKLDEVLAKPFTELSPEAAGPTTSTAYSDPPGTTDRRLVFISGYDGDDADADNDPFTGMDAGLLWVRVEIEGTVMAVESLAAPR